MSGIRKTTLASSVFELPLLGYDHEIVQINLSLYLEALYYIVCIISLGHHSWPITSVLHDTKGTRPGASVSHGLFSSLILIYTFSAMLH